MPWAFDLEADRVGSSIAARMAIMAITTSNSIRVKPCFSGMTAKKHSARFGARLRTTRLINQPRPEPAVNYIYRIYELSFQLNFLMEIRMRILELLPDRRTAGIAAIFT